jgi:hypothetical protein
MVAIKLTKESKYIITTFVEQHTHAFVSPNKHLIRSNREVGEKVKNTLFNFHRASIGTSYAYRFLRVGFDAIRLLMLCRGCNPGYLKASIS